MLTIAKLKAHTATVRPVAAAVLVAKAEAEVLREKVDAIKAEILAVGEYMSEPLEGRGKSIPARRITKPKEDWLIEDWAPYNALVDARVRAEVPGAADLEEGYCPALVAESKLRDAEQRLLEATAPLLNITASQINRSLDTRAKWLDTWLGACVNL